MHGKAKVMNERDEAISTKFRLLIKGHFIVYILICFLKLKHHQVPLEYLPER
jgi:hypothetical protein